MEDAWGDEVRIFTAYPRREDALNHLGTSEDALEPIEP